MRSFAATDSIVAHSEGCSCRHSATIRTARSRNSGGYLFDAPDMTPSSSKDRVSGQAGAIHGACVSRLAADVTPGAVVGS
jgi:hypothetical protein